MSEIPHGMTLPGTTTPDKARKRVRNASRRQQSPSQADGSLQLALTALKNAVYDLCHQRPQHTPAGPCHLDSRYDELRDALTGRQLGGTHTAPGSVLPTWIDALKLVIHIDDRVHAITAQLEYGGYTIAGTPGRLRHMTECTYRPQDSKQLENIASEISSWTIAIDDLFAAKPKYLPDPCPHCKQTHTHRQGDDGETVSTPALAIFAERGAVCQACHDVWPPDMLQFFALQLGYERPEGVVA